MPSFNLELLQPLLRLYLQLGGGVLLGLLLGRWVPQRLPAAIGQFLFWIGAPVSIIAFLRGADLSGTIWIAPVTAWMAILLGGGLAWIWLRRHQQENCPINPWSKPAQGSFLLASMVGNTGYLGFPISLALVGDKYFGWALFYDMLGSLIGTFGLGVILAAHYGRGQQNYRHLVQALLFNPALWSLGFGLGFRQIPLPDLAEQGLQAFAWGAIALSLLLFGMRLSQLKSGRSIKRASLSLGIKMLFVPLVLGIGLWQLGITGTPLLVIVLQMAMPPAFSTLVIAEVYHLDHELTVSALALGSSGLIVTLPIWLLLFGS